jgi:hypothetical protein
MVIYKLLYWGSFYEIRILRAQKEKNRAIKVIPMEWAEQVFLSRKGEPVKNSTYDTALFKICDEEKYKK